MIVNRQPVLPMAGVSGSEGSIFMTELMRQVGVRYIAPELDASYDDNWVNWLLGREDEWNPEDPGLVDAFLGRLDVRSVPGGVRFDLDEASVFIPEQEIGSLFSLYNSEAVARQQYDEAVALQEDAPLTRAFQDRLAEIIAAGNRGGSASDYQ
jgi:hypothetical protein